MTDEAQMFLTSAGAVTALQLEPELTVQTPSISLFAVDRHIAPSFPFCSPLLLLFAWTKPSSTMTAGGYPALHCCMWGGGGSTHQGKSSWLRAAVMCSLVVSSRRDSACFLWGRITLTELLRASPVHRQRRLQKSPEMILITAGHQMHCIHNLEIFLIL